MAMPCVCLLLLFLASTAQEEPRRGPARRDPMENQLFETGTINYQNGRITCTIGSIVGDAIFDANSCHMFLYANNKLKAQGRGNSLVHEYTAPIRAEVQCRAACKSDFAVRNNIRTDTIIIQEGPFIGLLCGVAIAFLLLLAVVFVVIVCARKRKKKEYKAISEAPPLPVKRAEPPVVVALPTEKERAAEEERAAEKERMLEKPEEVEEDAAPPLPEKQRTHTMPSMKQLQEAENKEEEESEGSSSDWDNTNAASYYPATATTRYAEVTSEI